jgi:glucose 1-dehydrogenase
VIGLVVTPRSPDTMRVEQVRDPAVRAANEILVRTVEVGVCGTDRAIAAGKYGASPPHDDFLVVGHEVVGVVERGNAAIEPGTLVAATVRRPCGHCANCGTGEMDACTTGDFTECGILGLQGFASEYFVETAENLVPIPKRLGRFGVLAEPASICRRGLRHAELIGHRQGWKPMKAVVLGVGAIGMLTVYMLRLAGCDTWAMARGPETSERARLVRVAGGAYVSTSEVSLSELSAEIGGADLIMESAGNAELVAEAFAALAPNGVLCLRGIDANRRRLTLPSTVLGDDLVLGNRAVFGSTNAGRPDWISGVAALEAILERWPDALGEIVGRTVSPDRFKEALDFDGVKATLAFSDV